MPIVQDSLTAARRMLDRYFVAQPIRTDRVTLTGGEAHHLAHVMRAKTGDEIVLFDGTGGEFPASVATVRRDSVELVIGARVNIEREARRPLTLGVSLPKGDRQRWLVEKSVELGVARLVPLITTRGIVQPGTAALARLRRAVVEASKQCGRNRLLEITEATSWPEFTQSAPHTAQRLIAHPCAGAVSPSYARPVEDCEVVLAVGAEGGWTDSEIEQAAACGWESVGLGPRILRIETAAVTLAAYFLLEPCPVRPSPVR